MMTEQESPISKFVGNISSKTTPRTSLLICNVSYELKIIPLQYINKLFGKNFKFHSYLNIWKNPLSYSPSFYKDILKLWTKYYSNQPSLPSTIVSQYLWFNSFIKIDNKVVFHRKFSEKNINLVNDLIKENGKLKTWEHITHECKIDKSLYFKWIQLVHAIPNHWKKKFTENTINSQNLSYLNHHFIKSNQIHSFEKLTAKELYLMSSQQETTTPTSQKYFESMFQDLTLQWKHIYTLPFIITIGSKLRCFQYKILRNDLYLIQKLFLFRKHNTSLCSFCNLEDQKVIHLFVHCSKTKRLWCTVIEYFKINLHIPLLS